MCYYSRISIFKTTCAVVISMLTGCTGSNQKPVLSSNDTGNVETTDSTVLRIDIKDAVPMSKGFGKSRVIDFDEDVENIMGIPQAIEISGDTIFAVDSYHAPGVYSYLMDGTQLWAYCSEGGAEHDVSSPFNLSVTDYAVSVYDSGARKLLTLDKEGNFLRKTDVHPDALNVTLTADGSIWTDYSNQAYADTQLSFRPTSEAEEIQILKVPEPVKGMTVVGMRSLTPLKDGSVNYLPPMQPMVYSLYDGKATIKYILDFGSLWPDDAEIKERFNGDSWARKLRDFPVDLHKINESDKWVAVSFGNKGDNYIYLYDKEENKGTTYIDDMQEFYSPCAISGDSILIQAKDNSIVVLNIK